MFAEENCGAWHAAEVDPTGGQFIIEMRICDLTYGLSAYVQIKNSSDKRLALAYRIVTKDDKSKDNDIILEPDSIARAGNCQACAKRYAGFKSWELLSAKATKDQPEKKVEAPVPAVVSTSPATPAPVKEQAVKEAEATPSTPAPAKVVDQPKPVESTTPAVAAVPSANNSTASQTSIPASSSDVTKDTEKKVDGFKAEDGTIIPWDKLPPEFRPRK